MGAFQRTLLGLLAAVIVMKHASAAQHSVGGSQGWDQSTDFNSWVSSQKFKVGDQLVFKYSQGLHSVVELTSESAYKNCDISTPLNSLSTGKDVVKLDKPGTRYFACGTLGHCAQGMKLKVTATAVDAPSTPSPTSPTSSSSSSSASPTTVSSTDTSAALKHIASLASIILSGVVLSICF
ncbi:hypothetical protein MLD38_022621 [Melastoma candidum]|uniref:Uncharacterized protein n=1 Tax=Melastoma candidum TaxID=119954 RepID=A0ACB9QJX8_9MYRT|nr:hypothetical protein MLD38_022621 [Melastoma candidum]